MPLDGPQPPINQPASGTYGTGADDARLKAALPVEHVGQGPAAPPAGPAVSPNPISAMPTAPGRPATGGPVPPGVPSVLLHPTQQPDTPVNTPLAPQQEAPGAVTPDQNHIAILDMLIHTPGVSGETKEWATTVLKMLFS